MKNDQCFEIEVTSEIWRKDHLTFYMLYPLRGEAVIKGLRGKFSLQDKVDIEKELRSRGIIRVRFEKKKDMTFKTISKNVPSREEK